MKGLMFWKSCAKRTAKRQSSLRKKVTGASERPPELFDEEIFERAIEATLNHYREVGEEGKVQSFRRDTFKDLLHKNIAFDIIGSWEMIRSLKHDWDAYKFAISKYHELRIEKGWDEVRELLAKLDAYKPAISKYHELRRKRYESKAKDGMK